MKTRRSPLAILATLASLAAVGAAAVLCLGCSPAVAGPQDRNSTRKPQASPATRTGTYRPITWPVYIRLPDDDVKDAAQLARFIIDSSRQLPGSSFTIALRNPPPVAELVPSLPPNSRVSGTNRITLADGAVVTLFQVRPGETKDQTYKRAFPLITVTREQLVPVLKDLPPNAAVTVQKPGSRAVTVTGDIPGAIKVVKAAPSGTAVSAQWGKRSVRYPRLK